MQAGRHYTAYRPSESRVADTVFRRPHMRTAGTAVVMRSDCVYDNDRRAGVAQSVEQRIRNAKVGGSIPFSGTISTDKRPSEKMVFRRPLCSVSDTSIRPTAAEKRILSRHRDFSLLSHQCAKLCAQTVSCSCLVQNSVYAFFCVMCRLLLGAFHHIGKQPALAECQTD